MRILHQLIIRILTVITAPDITVIGCGYRATGIIYGLITVGRKSGFQDIGSIGPKLRADCCKNKPIPAVTRFFQRDMYISIGIERIEMVFQFTFDSGVKNQYKYKLPAPFDQGDLPRSCYIHMDLLEPIKMGPLIPNLDTPVGWPPYVPQGYH